MEENEIRKGKQMGQKIFVLVGTVGEYEQASTTVFGCFSSEAEAIAAIPKLQELGRERWMEWQERDARKKQYLKQFDPKRVIPAGAAFRNGATIYAEEHYAQADEFCGPAPELIASADEYEIYEFGLGEIQSASSHAVKWPLPESAAP
jgi:hypothetical protein